MESFPEDSIKDVGQLLKKLRKEMSLLVKRYSDERESHDKTKLHISSLEKQLAEERNGKIIVQFQLEQKELELKELTKHSDMLKNYIQRLSQSEKKLEKAVDKAKEEKDVIQTKLEKTNARASVLLRKYQELRMENQHLLSNLKRVETNMDDSILAKEEAVIRTAKVSDNLKMMMIKLKENERKNAQFKARKTSQFETPKTKVGRVRKVLKPYHTLRSRTSRFYKLEQACKLMKRFSGDPSNRFSKDFVLKLDRKKEIKLKLSPEEAFQLYHCTRLTRRNYKLIKKIFVHTGVFDPLPGIGAVTGIESEVGSPNFFTVFRSKGVKKTEKDVVVVHLTDVVRTVERRIESLLKNEKLNSDFRDGVILTILGDKGSEEFKLCLAIAHVSNPNSCHHLIPLGVFDDDETAEAVKKHLGVIVEQLNRLKSVKVKVNGMEHEIPVVLFLSGDMKFQYDMIGHQGASSSFPCMLCTKKGKVLVQNYQRSEDIELRTEDSYRDYSARGDKKRTIKSVKAQSDYVFKSIPLSHLIPPSLHVTMGLAQKYAFDYLLAWAVQKDTRKKRGISSIRRARVSTVKIEQLEKEIKDLHSNIQGVAVVVAALVNTNAKLLVETEETKKKSCSAEICLYKDTIMSKAELFDTRIINCATCDARIHAACCGCWTHEDLSKSLDSSIPFDCFSCCGVEVDDILVAARKVLDGLKEAEVEKKEELSNHKQINENDLAALKGSTKHRILLEEAWKRWGAEMSVYQQNFCGNHVAKLLNKDAVDDYMSIFSDHPHVEPMKEFLKALGRLQKLCVPRNMSQDEYNEMETTIDTIWTQLKVFAAKDTVTPKLHLLLEHVLPFIRNHGWWARTSEQSIEAVHALYNSMKIQLRTTRNPVLRATQCFKGLLYKNYIFDHSFPTSI